MQCLSGLENPRKNWTEWASGTTAACVTAQKYRIGTRWAADGSLPEARKDIHSHQTTWNQDMDNNHSILYWSQNWQPTRWLGRLNPSGEGRIRGKLQFILVDVKWFPAHIRIPNLQNYTIENNKYDEHIINSQKKDKWITMLFAMTNFNKKY